MKLFQGFIIIEGQKSSTTGEEEEEGTGIFECSTYFFVLFIGTIDKFNIYLTTYKTNHQFTLHSLDN